MQSPFIWILVVGALCDYCIHGGKKSIIRSKYNVRKEDIMGLVKILLGINEDKSKKPSKIKTKAQIEKEKRELERKIWEMAEEYEGEE